MFLSQNPYPKEINLLMKTVQPMATPKTQKEATKVAMPCNEAILLDL